MFSGSNINSGDPQLKKECNVSDNSHGYEEAYQSTGCTHRTHFSFLQPSADVLIL